jgi:predicted GNAT family acetyltransferase
VRQADAQRGLRSSRHHESIRQAVASAARKVVGIAARENHRMVPMPGLAVEHRPDLSRFQAMVDGELSLADYHLAGGVMHMTRTAVPAAQQGRGIAAALVHAALAHARTQGLRINPLCSYVRRYMQRHDETADLLA